MKKLSLILLSSSFICASGMVSADSEVEQLKQQLESLKRDYEKRITALEKGLYQAQQKSQQNEEKLITAEEQAEEAELANDNDTETITNNVFNPQISLILDGRYANYKNDPDAYHITGYSLGGEAGLFSKGLSLGESELTLSSNIDQLFYGKITLSFADEDGNTELGIEEAFAQTSALYDGLTIKMGRFFSDIGYLNNQHAHAWDFADAPLIYRALFGDQYGDDGLQISYTAPTDLFINVGTEFFSGHQFPASGNHSGVGSWTTFVKLGGDFNVQNSWQIGLSHWQANNVDDRESNNRTNTGTTLFSGDSKINALDLIYKWSPNASKNHLKLQFEYFDRKEDGDVALDSFSSNNLSTYKGHQKGWYTQGIYQFNSQWRTGIRYDHLSSHSSGSNSLVLYDAGLEGDGYKPERYSAMIEWIPSEFSRIRLQYNNDQSYRDTDQQLFLQYTFSLGAHGAHSY
ncbi:hypothetical protein [sulfur-oxidizing endosymbiont of Gigantopelta aegis]|uniref:hypothetical protein n=1 Tax=sulfur-oxidizing endosymbiont of Gigantopelta aegis TaxID=2794934 RepID=UPI0018DE1CAE|nr:hypothetical protein [sulfur-oxidizing endosymbiont of Gigantopelta aegis]